MTAPFTGEQQVLDQSKRRKNWRAKDEFGRLWESTIDIISQGTCAPINPKGWNDPLNTPQKYLLKGLYNDPDTGTLGLRIIPALEAWASDLERDLAAYDQKLYNDAVMLFGEAGPGAYEKRTPALLHFTGEGPQALEPVLAALEGDEWALGLTKIDRNDIGRFFPKKETPRERFLRSLKKDDDRLLDVEEEADPEATGGKRIPVGKGRKPVEV